MANISVKNFDEVKKHLRDELKILSERLDKSIKSINKSDDPNHMKATKDLIGLIIMVSESLEKIEFSPNINISVPDVIVPDIQIPTINVPKPDAPIVNIPAPIVNVSASDVIIDIDRLIEALKPLRLLSDKPSSPISVRMSDGKKFVEAIQAVAKGQDKMMQVFTNSTGMTSDEYFATTKRLYRSATANNTFATVGVASSLILSANGSRISATFTNDSDSTIYLSKGQPAVVGSGIRLNASGGALINDEFTGDIYAISSGADKNMCISEVY